MDPEVLKELKRESKKIVYFDMDGAAGEFIGEHIHFGTEKFPDWDAVCTYLLK